MSSGGSNIESGIGLYTKGINSRATALLWKAGASSLVDDVRFLGGHGTNDASAYRVNPDNNDHSADPDIHRRWDAQYPNLWVTDDGGGTFADIWTPDTYAQAGLYVSNTTPPGYVYELSSEHHVRHEIEIVDAANWELDALQTEEERGESGFALPHEIHGSRNITVASYHSYGWSAVISLIPRLSRSATPMTFASATCTWTPTVRQRSTTRWSPKALTCRCAITSSRR